MPPTTPPTRAGTRRLSEVAKHLVVPTDIVTTGWPAVERTCRDKLGVTFDDWQDGAGRVILAKRADGHLAAMVDGVGLSLPRQVGKTYLIGAMVFALCVNIPGLLVIWSAHHARTHGETFLAMQGFASRAKVEPHVQQVFTGSGTEEIRFHNGSRILFGARERGFGRGIPGVDVLIFDEAQILSDRALANMLATLNTSQFGLQLYIGTPPKPEDMSESFTRMRTEALAGTLTDGAWIELGAADGSKGDDREQWRRANPSYPLRTPAQSLLRLKRKLTEADWLREGLGVWSTRTGPRRLIGAKEWTALGVPEAPSVGVKSFGVAFSADGTRVALAGALRHDDGMHVELVDAFSGSMDAGISALADWLASRWRQSAAFVLSGKAGAGVLADALRARKVPASVIRVATTVEYTTSCAMLLDGVRDGSISHLDDEGQAALDDSVGMSGQKTRLGGGWGWIPVVTGGDETPVEAVGLAVWGARTSKRHPGRSTRGRVIA